MSDEMGRRPGRSNRGDACNPEHDQRTALEHARHLAENGVPLFLARPDGDGFRLPKGWQNTEPDPSVVDRWRPGMALCAVMGHTVDAVDVDPRNGGDRAALNGTMPRTYGRQATPSGGTHDLVAALGVGSRDGFLPGVDLKGGRPDGTGRGFIFIAPTERADKGTGEVKPYRWTEAPDLDDLALIGGDESGIALAAQVRRERDPEPPPAREPREPATPDYADHVRRDIAWTLDRLDALAELTEGDRIEWPGVGEVGWDHGAFLAAMRLVQAANAGIGYSLEEAEADFMEHAPPSEGTYSRDHKWRQGMKEAGDSATPYTSAGEDFTEPLPEERVPPSGGVLERYPSLDLAALLDPNRPEREWLLPGLIPAGAQVALIARAGSMKSLLSLALAVAVARGDEEFAGVPIPRRRRVVYADMENPEDELAERFRALGVRAEDMEHLTYLHFPPLPPLDTEEGGRELVAVCEAYGMSAGDLLVLDSLQRVVEGPENDSDTCRAFYRHTMFPLKRLGLTVVRLDNTGKDQSRGSRGSSSKKDDVDVELFVTRDGETLLVGPGKEGKVRMAGIEPLTVDLNTDDDGRLTFTSALDPFRADVNATVAKMDELGLLWDVGERKAREALTGAKHDVPRRVLRQAVKERKYRADDYRRAPRQEESAHPRRGGESAA